MLSHFRIWECPTYVKYLKIDKLGLKSDKCLFIRYPKKTKRYYFYLAEEQKVFLSNRTIFLEKVFLGEELMPAKLNLMKFMR